MQGRLETRGILLAGTGHRCGKTIAAVGIAGALRQLGFKAQPLKPLSFMPAVSIRRGYEQAFFDRLLPPLQPIETFSVASPAEVGPQEWQRLLETCRKQVYPYILESPGGGAASPLRFTQGELMDAIDLSKALNLPVLLTVAKQPDLIAALAPVFAYLWHRDADVAGWLSVETQPVETPDWDTEVLYLGQHYRFPYLGEIAYSPSISVETLMQGNLFRQTEQGIDLLPIQQALELLIP